MADTGAMSAVLFERRPGARPDVRPGASEHPIWSEPAARQTAWFLLIQSNPD